MDLMFRLKLHHYRVVVNGGGIGKNPNFMRYSSQVRAARALLGWSQSKLARVAGVGLATLQRIEQREGVVKGNFSTVLKIQKALEKAGILFTDDEAGEIGVRLQISK
jgi:transcriptional regulator with XRE-family HTH domain